MLIATNAPKYCKGTISENNRTKNPAATAPPMPTAVSMGKETTTLTAACVNVETATKKQLQAARSNTLSLT